jgi:hypothetical protein
VWGGGGATLLYWGQTQDCGLDGIGRVKTDYTLSTRVVDQITRYTIRDFITHVLSARAYVDTAAAYTQE